MRVQKVQELQEVKEVDRVRTEVLGQCICRYAATRPAASAAS